MLISEQESRITSLHPPYTLLHLSIFHLSLLSPRHSALEFFFMQLFTVCPHLYLPPPCSFLYHSGTHLTPCPTTGHWGTPPTGDLSLRRLTIYSYAVFLKESSIKKGSGKGTVLKLPHSEQKTRNHWGCSLAFYYLSSLFIPQSSTYPVVSLADFLLPLFLRKECGICFFSPQKFFPFPLVFMP